MLAEVILDLFGHLSKIEPVLALLFSFVFLHLDLTGKLLLALLFLQDLGVCLGNPSPKLLLLSHR